METRLSNNANSAFFMNQDSWYVMTLHRFKMSVSKFAENIIHGEIQAATYSPAFSTPYLNCMVTMNLNL